ncbi:HD domain-containing protein [Fodinisporobacter ferrooxydans]|uniref:HD domain-containing protein n=1 Tax=Fodinisporobacter ferrooxydans TaxID=2901836 RepID=A0ABY4CWJ9_9BACL|nr:HD domain-containing protein [Alicyclobacillaceae bacterium MYW30-H2]
MSILQESLELLIEPLLQSKTAVLIADENRDVLEVNHAWEELIGISRENIIGQNTRLLKTEYTNPSIYCGLLESIENFIPWQSVVIDFNKRTKTPVPICLSIFSYRNQTTGRSIYIATSTPIESLDVLFSLNIDASKTLESRLVMLMTKIAEWGDPVIEKHIENVYQNSRWIAQLAAKANLIEAEQIEDLALASTLHDIGKIQVAKQILFKPDKLTPGEHAHMREHAPTGSELIDWVYKQISPLFSYRTKMFKLASEAARSHHEWWNGKGYPDGLAGENIPIAARITALADVIDALQSERPYKKSWSLQDIKKYIIERSATQFDPQLVGLVRDYWESAPFYVST